MWRRFWRRVINALRRDFLAGLLVFVPVGFTLLGVLWLVDQLDKLVLPNIFRALGLEIAQPRFLGAAVTLAAILLAGALTRSFVGRGALGAWEAIVERIPVSRLTGDYLYTSEYNITTTRGHHGYRQLS